MWALWVVLGLVLAPAGAADSVRAELEALGALSVNYSSLPVLNTSYVATVEFDMRAMGPLYNNSHYIIDAIVNKQAYPEGLVAVSDGHVELIGTWSSAWRPLAAHYGGVVSMSVLLLLTAAILPLAGLVWCCCRACRRRPRRPFDRKYDACWKGLLAIVLIALLTCFLFGIVCLFATESQVEAGLAGSGNAFRSGAADSRTFLHHSAKQARHVLVTNYQELETRLRGLLASAGFTVALKLGSASHGSSLATLQSLAIQLDGAVSGVQQIRTLTDRLRAHAERLNAALRRVRAQLLTTLARCDQPQCKRLQEKHRIGQLDTEIHYSQMPDMSDLLANLSGVESSTGESLSTRLSHGQRAYRRLQQDVASAVDASLPPLYDEIQAIGAKMSRVADEITYLAGNASERIQSGGAAMADTADSMHGNWGGYRLALAAGLGGALTAALGLLVLGLLCGVCGHRPDHYGRADCCNKAVGSRCLLCGVVMMFVLGSVSALVIVVYFLGGMAAQRLLCDPLTEPRDNRLFADVERFVDLERLLYNERTDPSFNLTYVMLRCHANHTLYEALQLSRLYPLEELSTRVTQGLRSRAAALRPPVASPREPVTLIDPPTRQRLIQLANSGLSDFDFDRVLDALETNMTSLSLSGLASQLESAAAALAGRAGFSGVARDLRDASSQLSAADSDILQPLLKDTATLNMTALQLRDGLRLNQSSLREAVHYGLRQAAAAEAYLNTEAPRAAINMTLEVVEVVADVIEGYMSRVRWMARSEVARCGPLSHAANATRDHHCRAALMPLNGFWIALCWCLILLPAIMAVCTRLARLYRSLDPYPGPLVEAEYLYDAYADRDNVPLANAYKAEKRAQPRRAGGAAGGAGAGAVVSQAAPGAAATAAPPADAAHARRYNDMAPKHWEEGPPRYHGPTEYERPPPYYYPGPHDRQ